MKTKTSLGQRLKEARRTVELSMEESAERLGTTRVSLGKYEDDEVSPQADMVLKMCRLYRCDPNYLLLGQERQSEAPAGARGVPVVGVIWDRSRFEDGSDKDPVEFLPLQPIGLENVYAMKVASNAMGPEVFSGEYIVFQRPKPEDFLEMTADNLLIRGSTLGKVVCIYRKPRGG